MAGTQSLWQRISLEWLILLRDSGSKAWYSNNSFILLDWKKSCPVTAVDLVLKGKLTRELSRSIHSEYLIYWCQFGIGRGLCALFSAIENIWHHSKCLRLQGTGLASPSQLWLQLWSTAMLWEFFEVRQCDFSLPGSFHKPQFIVSTYW